jgi:hypothetical protein
VKILIKSYLGKPPFEKHGQVYEWDMLGDQSNLVHLLNSLDLTFDGTILVFVNHQRIGIGLHHLREGDIVEIMPLLDGG